MPFFFIIFSLLQGPLMIDPLGDTRYVFGIPKYTILMKKEAIQNEIFRILVAPLASLICTS